MEARAFLTAKRKRLLGGVLGHCEQSSWWDELTRDQREVLRQKIIDEINVYHDNVLDVIRAIDGSESAVNVKVFEMLDRLDRHMSTASRVPR